MPTTDPLFKSDIHGLPKPKRGKVRDVYDLGDALLLVATDRISAFDMVFPTPIPDKGRILTSLTLFWLRLLRNVIPNHLVSSSLESLSLSPEDEEILKGRSLLVKKADVIPFECIVRGYLIGSGWREYRETGAVCGIGLPENLKLADKIPEPIFTPSTKAESGHDQNIGYGEMAEKVGENTAGKVRDASLELYAKASAHALEQGLIIADTKFEFGVLDGEIILIDEVLTPDSSRFWPLSEWKPGKNPPSFDKQYLRDWLETECLWNKEPPPPSLPDRVVEATRARYLDAYEKLSGQKLPK